jgi:hypothetical protein
MPFTIRPYRRFPLCCPVTYHAGLSECSRHRLERLADRLAVLRRSAAACRAVLSDDRDVTRSA